MAATAAACQGIWLKNLLNCITDLKTGPVVIYIDNRSAVDLANNPVFHGRSKHIDIRYHFIRECMERGEIEIKHVSSESQKADVMTKALSTVRSQVSRSQSPTFVVGASGSGGGDAGGSGTKKVGYLFGVARRNDLSHVGTQDEEELMKRYDYKTHAIDVQRAMGSVNGYIARGIDLETQLWEEKCRAEWFRRPRSYSFAWSLFSGHMGVSAKHNQRGGCVPRQLRCENKKWAFLKKKKKREEGAIQKYVRLVSQVNGYIAQGIDLETQLWEEKCRTDALEREKDAADAEVRRLQGLVSEVNGTLARVCWCHAL
ncbi:hypothetical protein AgCh_019583 [Apium graveolens]